MLLRNGRGEKGTDVKHRGGIGAGEKKESIAARVGIGEAVNGEDGFLKYKELRPDIVTMDITMPVMNGLESLLLIKHEDENAKVVMITAAGQKNNLMQAVKAGAEEFLTKPLEEEEIRRVIGEISAKIEK